MSRRNIILMKKKKYERSNEIMWRKWRNDNENNENNVENNENEMMKERKKSNMKWKMKKWQ